ncbi:MAG: hypothetical protein JWP74_265, partial [Marmoricola sp.]|nr:hypothetical protein [Marmoricola sp.]
GAFEIDQYAVMNGPKGSDYTSGVTWSVDEAGIHHVPRHDHSALKLRTDGNLVLESSRGAVLWSSHTAGTGTHNRLVLGARGGLVMYTSSNREVWSAHTGSIFLPAGRDLGAGQRLIATPNQAGGGRIDATLTMKPDGNLVSRCGRHVVWQTHTHVPGSILRLRNDAGLVVMTPSHKVVWSAHTGGHNSYSYLVLGSGADLTLYDVVGKSDRLWSTQPSGVGAC